MSWFKKATSWLGKTAKSAVAVIGPLDTPLVSSLVGAIPVIGGIGSKFVDTLGNKVLSGFASSGADSGNSILNYIDAAASNNSNVALSFPEHNFVPTTKGFLGIGDGKPGVFGIGDGKPGVFGVGTGKGKARKAAEASARAAGGTPGQILDAGDRAAAAVTDPAAPASGGSAGLIAAAAAAALLLLL